jgi:hypothetical protein
LLLSVLPFYWFTDSCTKIDGKDGAFACVLGFSLIPNNPPSALLFLEFFENVPGKKNKTIHLLLSQNSNMLIIFTIFNLFFMFILAALLEKPW